MIIISIINKNYEFVLQYNDKDIIVTNVNKKMFKKINVKTELKEGYKEYIETLDKKSQDIFSDNIYTLSNIDESYENLCTMVERIDIDKLKIVISRLYTMVCEQWNLKFLIRTYL